MKKQAKDIKVWGKIKPFFDKSYSFNSLDIETIDNELFLIGCNDFFNDEYIPIFDNFFYNFNEFLIKSLQTKHDILTWSRYDNTQILKLILQNTEHAKNYKEIIEKVGKITPILSYKHNDFTITLLNIIRDTMIFQIIDFNGRSQNIIIYNLKNLFHGDLLSTTKEYNIPYSKLGDEYHIIDKERFYNDLEYKKGVLLSNKMDSQVLPKIAYKLLDSFKKLTGRVPKSIFSNGSLARSYLLSMFGTSGSKMLQFKSMFSEHEKSNYNKWFLLLDYSMKSYFGGKIDSYVIGSVGSANVIDITSAYPWALTELKEIDNTEIYVSNDINELNKFFYAFIECDIIDIPDNLYHSIIVPSPLSHANITPSGYIERAIITKLEYDFLIENNVEVKLHRFVAVGHKEKYPYKDLINTLFNDRIKNIRNGNVIIANLIKTILNSLYGITYELTPLYEYVNGDIKKVGLRAGDYFNPIIASYITAMVRVKLSKADNLIQSQGGEILLNMTDSIFYKSDRPIDFGNLVSENKILGLFETPEKITNLTILGAGRYEYTSEKGKHIVKSRGFNANVSDSLFYRNFDLNKTLHIKYKEFVTAFKATTLKYELNDLGSIIENQEYNINPLNIGGKRLIENINQDLNNGYTRTLPIRLEKGLNEKVDLFNVKKRRG